MIERKWYDITGLSKDQLVELLSQANEVKDRVEYRRDLTGFEGTTEEAIKMIKDARHNGFHCFREKAFETEFEFGCHFWTKVEHDFVLNIRVNEEAGRALIKKFNLEEWQP